MVEHLHVALVATAVGGLITLLAIFLWRWCCSSKQQKDFVGSTVMTTPNGLQAGIARLHQQSTRHHPFDFDSKTNRGNYYVFRRGPSAKVKFNWGEHPSLVTDAVENGWSQFAFVANSSSYYMSSPSFKASTLLGLYAAGDHGRQTDALISWEVCQGSVDFMQKVRLNPGTKRIYANSSPMAVASVIRTALPLPGPNLGNSSFPQEAYFEITVLDCREDHDFESTRKIREGEKTKLIQADFKVNSTSDASFDVSDSPAINKNGNEDLKLEVKRGKDEILKLSLGLSAGGSLPLKVPGSYPGSMGFNSSGSVYLDGMKLVYESDVSEWGNAGKVIGCGFDPRERKVFFTVDSELVHIIHCSSEEFGTPMYPTLAANVDVLVLVNLGQSEFKYVSANASRTPNPCFTGPPLNSAALDYEDSKELFSMGRIDSQWFNRTTAKGSHNHGHNINGPESFEEESEADLFEISLDNGGKSHSAV